jgi:hypothetical protein
MPPSAPSPVPPSDPEALRYPPAVRIDLLLVV